MKSAFIVKGGGGGARIHCKGGGGWSQNVSPHLSPPMLQC